VPPLPTVAESRPESPGAASVEEAAKEVLFGAPEFLDFHKIIAAAEHGAEADHQNVDRKFRHCLRGSRISASASANADRSVAAIAHPP
jgi:hypothetical protein